MKVYCDQSLTTMKAVDQMAEKKVYVAGTVMKLPSDQNIEQ